jgi:hypothetical protein
MSSPVGYVEKYAVVTVGPGLRGGQTVQLRSPALDTIDEARAWRRSDGTQRIARVTLIPEEGVRTRGGAAPQVDELRTP